MKNTTTKDFFVLKDVSACSDIPLKNRVRVLLLRKGMSQNQLADEVGITKTTMSSIVNEHWIPTSRIKLLMGKILECDSLVLFGGSEYWSEWREKIGYPEKEFTNEDAERELNEILGKKGVRKCPQ